ncbi:hypothetical protein [Streptomyces xanthochromogenes]
MSTPAALPPAHLKGRDRTGNIPLAARGFSLPHDAITGALFAIAPRPFVGADAHWRPAALLGPRLVRITTVPVAAEGGE